MKTWIKTMAAASIGLACLTSCMPAGAKPVDYSNLHLVQLEEPADGAPVAVVETTLGNFSFVLYEEYAPNTVAQFKQLVEEGFYTDNVIYSVEQEINVFMAGALDASGAAGKTVSEDGKGVETETALDLWHFTGAISAFGKESGTFSSSVKSDSRFFAIGHSEPTSEMVEQLETYNFPEKVISTYKQVGGQPIYTGQYTVFGQIYEGMETVKSILSVAVEEKEEYENMKAPVEDILIKNITLSTYQAEEKE